MKVYAVCGGNQADTIYTDRTSAEEYLTEKQEGDPEDFGAWRIEEREMTDRQLAELPPYGEA